MKKYLKNKYTMYYIMANTFYNLIGFLITVFLAYATYIAENKMTSQFKFLLIFILVYAITYFLPETLTLLHTASSINI